MPTEIIEPGFMTWPMVRPASSSAISKASEPAGVKGVVAPIML